MKPIPFKQRNAEIGGSQAEYQTLPAFMDQDGLVVSCWSLTLWERIKVALGFPIWLHVLTFNRPFQPVVLDIRNPFTKEMEPWSPDGGQ